MKVDSANAGKVLVKKYLISLSLVFLVLFSSSACGMIPIFDEKVQDKAACDKLSDVWTMQGADTSNSDEELLTWINSTNAFGVLADQTESEVLPLASMKFSSDIKELIKYLRLASSQSIFDRLASWTYGLDSIGQVTYHCVQVARA